MTSPARGRDNGALSGVGGTRSPPPSPRTLPSWCTVGGGVRVEDGGGRCSFQPTPADVHPERLPGNPRPQFLCCTPAPTFYLTSPLLNFSVTSTRPDPYPIYLWPPHLLGLQSVLQPGPPLPAWRPASGPWSRPLSWHPLPSVCGGVGAGGQRGPATLVCPGRQLRPSHYPPPNPCSATCSFPLSGPSHHLPLCQTLEEAFTQLYLHICSLLSQGPRCALTWQTSRASAATAV